MSLEFNGIKLFPISELQVSQIFLNKRKIDDIYKWFKPKDVKNYEPLPVHDFGDGKYTLTDGHSRAYVAFKEGVTHIPIVYDNVTIGNISVNTVNKKHNYCNVGYVVRYDYWGNGYAGEALKTVSDYLLDSGYYRCSEIYTIHPMDKKELYR